MNTYKRTHLACAGGSHQGLVRSKNEDLFYCDPEGGIFIVVDGVGGHAGGDRAADIALTVLRSRLEQHVGGAEGVLREAIADASNEIYRHAQEGGVWSGMSCVLTAAIIEGDMVTVGHVGDTRLYRIHAGRITQLTHDHSFVGNLVACGFIDENEAMRHPRRNEITRDVGSNLHQPDDADFIEISKHSFQPNCALLMCSDGLSDLVSPEQILSIVTEFFNSPEVVNCLIGAANAAGGKDNITVVYVVATRTGPPVQPE
jgi:serine/threonine protein phosphatase PrpC